MILEKKGQIFSVETYIAVGIFLFALIFFYVLITVKTPGDPLKDEAGYVTDSLLQDEYFKDNMITYSEAQEMATWNCSQIRTKLKTSKNICIYFTDQEGNLIPLTNTEPRVYAIGCPGINVSGNPCGELES